MNVRRLTLLVSVAFFCAQAPGLAQAAKARPPAKKQAAKPAPKKVEAPPRPKAPPAPAPPKGLRFKTRYTTGDQVNESVTCIQANRERYELADMILLKQHDQKRTVQISRAASVYLVTPEGSPAAPSPDASSAKADAAPKPPGVVTVATAIVDTGERKTVFGHEARHVTTTIERQPQPGACDPAHVRIETDGWYIDQPGAVVAPAVDDQAPPAAANGCADRIEATRTGDPGALGFPMAYTTTFTEVGSKDSPPVVVSMEVTEFEEATLDAGLFEIPPDMKQTETAREWSKAVSDANEAKLASGAPMPGFVRDKKAGVVRVGVPEVANDTSEDVDTRALRARLIAELEQQKIEAVPMAAAPMADLQSRAADLGADYLLLAEITELKASKAGGLTRMMKVAASEGAKDITQAKMIVSLVPPGGRPALSTTVSAKEGGVGLKTGIGLAKFAGSLYLRMYMGGMYGNQMGAFGAMRMMHLSGLGAMQAGLGTDRTALAANIIMQQVATAASAGSDGPSSFDAALDGAVQSAGKHVVEALKKAQARK